MKHPRVAGIAVPLSSLRSESDHGIGDLEDLKALIEWAARSGQRLIALLPLGESGPGESSPYNALSSFALDPIYLRPEALPEFGLPASRVGLPSVPARQDRVDHDRVRRAKEPLFQEAFDRFQHLDEDCPRRRGFAEFRRRSAWLADYAIFRALFEEENGRSWKHWPEPLRQAEPRAIDAARGRLRKRIAFYEYLQFAAEEGWRDVRSTAAKHGVALIGDLPFAPSENSVDVWANPTIFDLTRSAGAPPDAFSPTGQRWGLPMYRWQAMRQSGWRWLRALARRMGELYDVFRIDHVVGLFRTFNFIGEAPSGFDPLAENAQIAQGKEILEIVIDEARPASLVAEDLGTIPPFVIETLAALDVPGYKVLRWQRREEDHRYIDPLEYPESSVATTGTHDTDTLLCWWRELSMEERRALLDVVGRAADAADVELSREQRHAILGRLYRSPSRYVILPIQDLFGWPERINTPATTSGDNWVFRLPLPLERFAADRHVSADSAALRALIDASGRLRKIG